MDKPEPREALAIEEPKNPIPWPDPTPEMVESEEFKVVWDCIKRWDINVPNAYGGYCGATGNHVQAILDSLKEFLYYPGCGCSIDPYKPECCEACGAKEPGHEMKPIVYPPNLSEFANWMVDNWYGNDLQIVSKAIQQFRETRDAEG
jgi:hypothetical protein